MTKHKKPSGTSGPIHAFGGSVPEFKKLLFPMAKDEIERLILRGAVRTARSMNFALYSLTDEPDQNEENSFDFTLPTLSGREYLELAEVVAIKGPGGYDTAANTYVAGEFSDLAFALIKKKAKKYGLSRRTKVHLLLYTTDWRFRFSPSVINLLCIYCSRKRHAFKTIAYYHPVTKDEGIIWQLYPNPLSPEEFATLDEKFLRSRIVHQGDPTKPRPLPDGTGLLIDF